MYFDRNQKWIFNTKGQHSVKTESSLRFLFPVKNVGAPKVLLLRSFSDDALYLYQISEQFSKLLSGHYFQTEIFKGHYSLKNVGRVMVLNLCTSSYDALYLVTFVQSFMKIFSTVLK